MLNCSYSFNGLVFFFFFFLGGGVKKTDTSSIATFEHFSTKLFALL